MALLPAPGAAASGGERVLVYRITRASGFIRADFDGAREAGCETRGVCGYSGAVRYQFGGTPHSAEAFLLLGKRSGFVGGGNFRTSAVTLAKVGIPGSDPCTDSVAHSADNFQLTRRSGRITVSFHGAQADTGPDYLNTRCPGPGEVDLTYSRALPTGTFGLRFFETRYVTIRLSGERTFTGGGFTGTSTWNVTFTLARSHSASGVATTFF